MRVIEAVERLIGARPGQKLEVNFRAASLEKTIRRAGRRLALGLTAGAAILATGLDRPLDAHRRVGPRRVRGRRRACSRSACLIDLLPRRRELVRRDRLGLGSPST